jgi:hypothetical protein
MASPGVTSARKKATSPTVALPTVRAPTREPFPVRFELNGTPIAFWIECKPDFIDFCRKKKLRLDHSNGDLVSASGARTELPVRSKYSGETGNAAPPWLVFKKDKYTFPAVTGELRVNQEGHFVAPRSFRAKSDSLSSDPRSPALPVGTSKTVSSPFRDPLERSFAKSETVLFQDVGLPRALNGRIPTTRELLKIHREFQRTADIPTEYIVNGCDARAQEKSDRLAAQGINHAKIFVSGLLHAQNDHMDAFWKFHVAPLVFAKGPDGKSAPWVLDASLSPKLLSPRDWVQAIRMSDPVVVDVTGPEQYSAPPFYGRGGDAVSNRKEAAHDLKQTRAILDRTRVFAAGVESVDGKDDSAQVHLRGAGGHYKAKWSAIPALKQAMEEDQFCQVAIDDERREIYSALALDQSLPEIRW